MWSLSATFSSKSQLWLCLNFHFFNTQQRSGKASRHCLTHGLKYIRLIRREAMSCEKGVRFTETESAHEQLKQQRRWILINFNHVVRFISFCVLHKSARTTGRLFNHFFLIWIFSFFLWISQPLCVLEQLNSHDCWTKQKSDTVQSTLLAGICWPIGTQYAPLSKQGGQEDTMR